MRGRSGWVRTGFGWLLGAALAVVPARAGAALPTAPEAGASSEAHLAALHRCFQQQVRHHHRPHPMAARHTPAAVEAGAEAARPAPTPPGRTPAPDAEGAAPAAEAEAKGASGGANAGNKHPGHVDHAPLGPAAEIFFFDQLADSERELGAPVRLLWCRPWFASPYLRAHHTLSRRSRVARPVPHPNDQRRRIHHFSHHNDATRVLRAAAHAGGLHPAADKARAAVEALAEHGGGPTALDADWLALTALLPELYLFEAPHAHAFTPDAGDRVGLAQAERARARFVAHVRATVARAHAAELAGDHAETLLHVGVAAHALHDLAMHRGMTEAEHAALTFVRHTSPDRLATDQQHAQASRALQDLFARMWPAGAAADVRWRNDEGPPPRSRALAQGMIRAYPHAREVDYAALLHRYQSGHALVAAGRGGGGPGELVEALVGRWDVDTTLRDIWREDEASD